MKILTLSNSPLDERLGSGKSVVRYTRELERQGHQILAFGPEDFEIFPNFRRATKLKQAFGALFFVKQQVNSFSPDLVELYGDEFWLVVKWLKSLKKPPLIVAHTNGLELFDWDRRRIYEPESDLGLRGLINRNLHQRLSRLFFSSVDGLVCLSESDRSYAVLNGVIDISKSEVVSPGLDQTYLSSEINRDPQDRIAFTGSWITRKGVSLVITAITRVLKEFSNYHFDIFGSQRDSEDIKCHFPNEIRERIHVYGSLKESELTKKLASCKIFIFPSHYEGFGMALAEAMACGCCVISTPSGFGAELNDGIDGFIVPFGDAESLYQRMLLLIQDNQIRALISANAKRRAISLNWQDSGDKLSMIYKKWHAARLG